MAMKKKEIDPDGPAGWMNKERTGTNEYAIADRFASPHEEIVLEKVNNFFNKNAKKATKTPEPINRPISTAI